ncbi:hypothetical protein [Actinocorallia sp. A-T 12471]|uniref:hypothetical protein n=1 Tax=Actinocorallia sp. A-T 12471 TaxID=3089813 RepID=UPI0029CBC580|nr:hypothetical protein [Actinocorallia sp. A-T 12471]MDX6744499.1 hypothetical protein [Actinocorallia sp. A-T 12471]
MITGDERPPRTALGALLPFGLGALGGGLVCAVVLALPEPVKETGRAVETLTPPVVREPVDGTDVRVTVDRRQVRIENVSRARTGRLTLEFDARHRAPADCGACVWPRGLAPGGALTVTLRPDGHGPIRVRAVTEVPDREPSDNEIETRGR